MPGCQQLNNVVKRSQQVTHTSALCGGPHFKDLVRDVLLGGAGSLCSFLLRKSPAVGQLSSLHWRCRHCLLSSLTAPLSSYLLATLPVLPKRTAETCMPSVAHLKVLKLSISWFQPDHSEQAVVTFSPRQLQTHSPEAPTKATPHPENAADFKNLPKSEAKDRTTPRTVERAYMELCRQMLHWLTCLPGGPTIQTPGGNMVPSALHTLVRISTRLHSS